MEGRQPGSADVQHAWRAISDYAAQLIADGVEVRVAVDLARFDDDVAEKAELDGCVDAVEPYVARRTYLCRPLDDAHMTDSEDEEVFEDEETDDGSGDLTVADYEWLISGGEDETSARSAWAAISSPSYTASSVSSAPRA